MSETASSISLEKFKELIEISTRINSNYGNRDTLLRSIVESMMCLVQCESGSILLTNPKDDNLQFMCVVGPKRSEVKKIIVGQNSIAGWVAANRKPQIINDANNDFRFNPKVQEITKYKTRNMIAFPMVVGNECFGVIELLNKAGNQDFTQEDLKLLVILGNQAAIAYKNSEKYAETQEQVGLLQNAVNQGKEYHSFIAKSQVVLDLLKVIKNVAKTNSSVLIIGESGVGKELFAEQLHLNSERRNFPFVRVSCAALSPSLLESELFGHVKGAFTDAVSEQKGRFEMADKGTIFLDEIGELPLNLQSKLLRVIQERKFERVGSSKTISVDVRIIAATNRNLEEMVSNGSFRDDLYFRLNVVPINIPPLRERTEDIEPLCQFFLEKFSQDMKKNFAGFSREALKAIYSYYWPGNIRELENTVERACILGVPPLIQVSDLHLPSVVSENNDDSTVKKIVVEAAEKKDKTLKTALNEFKKEYISQILSEVNWNQTEAAKVLGIQRTYVSRLLNELDIKR
ncbi:MAG: sigma 54-interacting transcriptional regulator [Treponema sp.]|nr:sigma 54-interacting transcriptional regulator [Spirochaetia bacterium]MDD7013864.1 sigma 54-interacting transcriptional regulator [Spirochaetales bacterium]MDY4903046.1 sigma 54-interacting transcriptional regulator [Treponema sp.]